VRGIGGATDDLAGGELAKVTAQIEGKVQEKLAADKGLEYASALKLVASENPELNVRYTALVRRRAQGGNE